MSMILIKPDLSPNPEVNEETARKLSSLLEWNGMPPNVVTYSRTRKAFVFFGASYHQFWFDLDDLTRSV